MYTCFNCIGLELGCEYVVSDVFYSPLLCDVVGGLCKEKSVAAYHVSLLYVS
jgi:hypothetical protein